MLDVDTSFSGNTNNLAAATKVPYVDFEIYNAFLHIAHNFGKRGFLLIRHLYQIGLVEVQSKIGLV